MRELKFRVWSVINNCFVTNGCSMSVLLSLEYEGAINSKDIYQQYTGLTDCKGKDIYEGDIIKETRFEDWQDKSGFDYFGVVKHVVYTDNNNGLQVSTYSSFPKIEEMAGYAGNQISVKCEVIGNIFGFPCRPDHNGECLICDCWLSDCPMADLVKLDKAKKVK